MARMNVDDQVRGDVRVKRLVLRLKEPRQLVMGRLYDVWWVCYDQRAAIVAIDEVDAAAELEGMAAAMVACGLASDAGAGMVRIAGAESRVRYLQQAAEAGRKGGQKRAAQMKADPERYRDDRGRARRVQAADQATPGDLPHDDQGSLGDGPRVVQAATTPLPLPLPLPQSHPLDQSDQATPGDNQGSLGEAVELPADVDPDLAEVLAAAIGSRDANQGNVDAKERARQASLEDERRRELQSGRGGRAGVPPRAPAAYRRNGTEVIR